MADTTDGPGPAPPRVLSDRFITAHLSAVVGTWPLAFSASHHARRIYSTVWCAIVTAQPMIYRNGSLVALSLLFFSFLFSPLVVVVAVATRTAASAISRSVLTNSLPLQRRTSLKMRENSHFFFKVHHLQLPMHYVQMFSGAHTLLMIIWRDAASSSANDGVLPSIRSILIYFT